MSLGHFQSPAVTIVFAHLSLIYLATWTTCLVVAHFRKDHLNPLFHAVSEMGNHWPTRLLIAICWFGASFCGGFLCIALAAYFHAQSKVSDAAVPIAMFAIYSVSRILTWAFPTRVLDTSNGAPKDPVPDGTDPPSPLCVKLHYLFAIISFASITVAANQTGRSCMRLSSSLHLREYGKMFEIWGWVILGTIGAMLVLARFRLFGLGERLFYLAQMSFIGALSVVLLAA